MTETRLILGGPGAGKTQTLIGRVEKAISKGFDPERIAFVSFTKQAALEAAERASKRFSLDPNDMPYFSTIHAMCFRELGLRRSDVMGRDDWGIIANTLGIEITGNNYAEDTPGAGTKPGDRCISLINYARATRQDLKEVWQDYGEDTDWWQLKQLESTIAKYKLETGKLAFDDMLAKFLLLPKALPVDLAVIDEAQDLTAAQWAVTRKAFADASHVLIGGDDDQAIYEWSGADIRYFLHLDVKRHALPKSHRLAKEIWQEANKFASRISHRYEKNWASADHSGEVHRVMDVSDVDFSLDGSWMVLGRNAFLLERVKDELYRQGVSFVTRRYPSVDPRHVRAIISWERRRNGRHVELEDAVLADSYAGPRVVRSTIWHDALVGIDADQREYYRALLRRGRRLQDPPVVRLDTIHGVKGAEADNVVLFTDVSKRTHESFIKNPDAEHRVFYVGATRARRRLFIVEPSTDLNYPTY